MREYFITKSDLWYLVFRKKTENNLETKEWLQNNSYTLNKKFARVFYHLNDATSALVIARRRWDTDTISEEVLESIPPKAVEKQSWSDF